MEDWQEEPYEVRFAAVEDDESPEIINCYETLEEARKAVKWQLDPAHRDKSMLYFEIWLLVSSDGTSELVETIRP